ncbi:hypothetical protein pb186bvf_002088 [Paramecium bursaria]
MIHEAQKKRCSLIVFQKIYCQNQKKINKRLPQLKINKIIIEFMSRKTSDISTFFCFDLIMKIQAIQIMVGPIFRQKIATLVYMAL